MADDDTLRAWRAGDAAAGRALVDAHFEAVFRFFRNKCNEDVEDLVQTTFAKCLAGADAFRGQASVRTYLLTIARNELYDHWSRRRRDATRAIQPQLPARCTTRTPIRARPAVPCST